MMGLSLFVAYSYQSVVLHAEVDFVKAKIAGDLVWTICSVFLSVEKFLC